MDYSSLDIYIIVMHRDVITITLYIIDLIPRMVDFIVRSSTMIFVDTFCPRRIIKLSYVPALGLVDMVIRVLCVKVSTGLIPVLSSESCFCIRRPYINLSFSRFCFILKYRMWIYYNNPTIYIR
jgi:hypothetical protein